MQLSLLAQATVQTIERYYMVVAQLVQAGSGVLDQATLEERCQLTAQRMTLLYGLNSPEFFDPAMFENFIGLLRTRGVIRSGAAHGRLEFDEVLTGVAADAQYVLSEQLQQWHPATDHAHLKQGDVMRPTLAREGDGAGWSHGVPLPQAWPERRCSVETYARPGLGRAAALARATDRGGVVR